jgi:hypothetical protein
MEYTFEIDNVSNICTVRITGSYHRSTHSPELKQFACDLYKEKGCRHFLFDMTNAHMASRTIDTFSAANPKAEMEEALRHHRTAILLSEITEDDRFFETVAVNRGFQLRIFNEIDKAMEWLKPKKSNT